MAKESKAQEQYIKDVRIHNSIDYFSRTKLPRCLRNIAIVRMTMNYNDLTGDRNSFEYIKTKVINCALLIFTVTFEMLVFFFKMLAFFFKMTGVTKGNGSRKMW